MGEAAELSESDYFDLTHFTDSLMNDQEILELPKVWVVGGDGGMGDIGFQNVSKVVLQNRPNVKLLMLDTQVYSNTGGQNSDSSPAPGGADMNQVGAATQGKVAEKKSLSEIFTSGHGSPFVAQISMANSGKLFKTIIEMLEYRGTGFLQSFTSCQPEHGVADDVSAVQAKRIRDSRGMPEFVFTPASGETYDEAISLQGNPGTKSDWWEARYLSTKTPYKLTVAHWAATEARFRRHFKPVKPDEASELLSLDSILELVTQNDVINRRHLDPNHRAWIPDFGCFIDAELDDGRIRTLKLSRQMVIFCVERRKAWRMLQSKAGIANPDYARQKELLKEIDSGKLTREKALARLEATRAELKPAQAGPGPGAATTKSAKKAKGDATTS